MPEMAFPAMESTVREICRRMYSNHESRTAEEPSLAYYIHVAYLDTFQGSLPLFSTSCFTHLSLLVNNFLTNLQPYNLFACCAHRG